MVCVSYQDVGRLLVWVLREYDEIEPIILSGEYSAVPTPLPALLCPSVNLCDCVILQRKWGKVESLHVQLTQSLFISFQWVKRMRSPSKTLWK